MKPNLILGIALILIGAAILGPIKATAETTKTVPVPPILGWALLASGACVLVFSARSKS